MAVVRTAKSHRFGEAIERVELSLLVRERGRIREQGMTSALPPPGGPIARDSIVTPATDTVIRTGYATT